MLQTLNNIQPTCSAITCKVKDCLIKSCSGKWQEFALSNKTTITYKKGQTIIMQGTIVTGIYFIFSGKVKVTTSWSSEKEQIIRFAKSGDVIGHRGFGSEKLKYYPISAIAIEDTRVCFLENEVIYKLLKTNMNLTNKFMQFYAEELFKTEIRINIISQKPVRERVAIALIELMKTFGYENNGSITLDVMLSRQDLANFVGTTKENISNFISEFKKDRHIETEGKKIKILNLDGLQKVSNLSDYSRY